jgi:predicted permease
MRGLRRLLSRTTSWATRARNEERLRAEIEEHLALQTEEYLRMGLSQGEARRHAALKFGGVEAMKEEYREQRGLPVLETLTVDARLALRRLRLAPAFTLSAVLTLALGIGSITAIFTLAHAVLLKSLPVRNPGELYRLGKEARCCYVGGYSQENEFSLVSYDLYGYLRDHTQGFSELSAFSAVTPLFGVRRAGSADGAQSYPGEFVSGNYFAMFAVGAYAGRALTYPDDQPGAPPAAVMSYRLWQERYGSDPTVIGGTFNLNDKPFTVVGIAPPGFFGDTLRGAPPDFFVPLNAEPYVQVDADLKKYATHWLELIGRLRPGAEPRSVEAEMRVGLQQWLRAHWGEMSANERAKLPSQTLYLNPGGAGITNMRERYQQSLRILLMISGFVLLIVCANVANLVLVRGMEQRRQTALSVALGAGAGRVVRQALMESTLLALLGGAAGLAVAFGGTRLIIHLAFPAVPGLAGVPIDATPSMPVLMFAFVASLLAAVAFGAVPAWMSARIDAMEALRGAGRSTIRTVSLPKKALVVFQAALSLASLCAAGLLSVAFLKLENRSFGFEQERRIVVRINPRLAGYRTDQLRALYRGIHDSMAGLPGVSSAALCLYAPQSGGDWGARVWVEGQPPPGPLDDHSASWNRVAEGYLDVIGTSIVRGRGISEQDTADSRKVAVVNEAFAHKFFRGEDPIGKHFGTEASASGQFEVVGVARDARYLTTNLDRPVVPFFLVPETQADYGQRNVGSLFLSDIVILTRQAGGLSDARIRQAMAAVDPSLPIVSVRTMKQQIASQLTQQRLIAQLTSFFGVLALVLASIGLYGLTAYNVGRRVNEIGVRMALGADRGRVIRMILRGTFSLTVFGLLLGFPLTLTVGRLLGSQLYGMNPYEPVVILSAASALGLCGLAACCIPAFRASSIAPASALRAE